MHEFDIDVPGTIHRWEPWRKKALTAAGIILLAFGFWMFVWITFLANVNGAILGN